MEAVSQFLNLAGHCGELEVALLSVQGDDVQLRIDCPQLPKRWASPGVLTQNHIIEALLDAAGDAELESVAFEYDRVASNLQSTVAPLASRLADRALDPVSDESPTEQKTNDRRRHGDGNP